MKNYNDGVLKFIHYKWEIIQLNAIGILHNPNEKDQLHFLQHLTCHNGIKLPVFEIKQIFRQIKTKINLV